MCLSIDFYPAESGQRSHLYELLVICFFVILFLSSLSCSHMSLTFTDTINYSFSVTKTGAFDEDDVTHVEGEVDPVRDLEIISDELRLKDIELLHSVVEKVEKNAQRSNDKKLKEEYNILMKIKALLIEEKRHIRFQEWNTSEVNKNRTQ